MKTILFYDTETTGLPLFREPSDHPDQPYITQLAAELCIEETGEVLGSMNVLIDPDGIWSVPDDVAALTGITTEKCMRFGISMDLALSVFLPLWHEADLRAAHNESFDMRLVRIAMMRDPKLAPHADDWKAAPAYCTCDNSKSIINLPPTEKMRAAGNHNPKPPKLTEAYEFFTGKQLDGAHNAMVDVHGCKEVYYALRNRIAVAA